MFAPRLCLAVIALSAIAVVLAEGEEDATIEAAFEEEPSVSLIFYHIHFWLLFKISHRIFVLQSLSYN